MPGRRHLLLPVIFLLVAGQLGAFLALTVPPGDVPDEHAHAMRADSLLHGEILAHRDFPPGSDGKGPLQQGAVADYGLLEVTEPIDPHAITSKRWSQVTGQPWTRAGFTSLNTIASYWPIFYVPAATAIGLAKVAGRLPFSAFHLARLANLAVYLGLGAAALLLAHRGQVLLFCTLTLPTEVSLAASINQDGLIIAASVLAVALLTRCSMTPLPLRRDPARMAASLLLVSIAMAKPPYLPMAGLLLLPFPPLRLRSVWFRRLGLCLIAGLATATWTGLTLRYVATPLLRPPAEAGPLWPGLRPAIFAGIDIAAQFRVLWAAPTLFFRLPIHEFLNDPSVGRQAIGVLGWLDVVLPGWLYVLWAGALGSAVGADMFWRREPGPVAARGGGIFALACIMFSIFGIYLSQYLSWTPVGENFIGGIQGRYFLPLLPILVLSLPRLPRVAVMGAVLTVPAIAACLLGAVVLPGIIVRHYYLH